MLDKIESFALQGRDIALAWLTSPAAYAQFALLAGAFLLALLASAFVRRRLKPIIAPRDGDDSYLGRARRYALVLLPLTLPIAAYAFTAIGEQIARQFFGAGAVIAFGKRFFIFLAVRQVVTGMITEPFLKSLGRLIILPIAALYVVGLLGPLADWLDATRVTLGRIDFSVMALLRAAAAGSILFWLGRWSSERGTSYIRAQETMRPPTRELAAKAFELAVIVAFGLILLNVMGLNLSALAIFGGAVGVGLGFGLQKIASNFISGIILLLEGQATVGDFVELDGGESGTIVRMGARATILETFDGKWIVVPNEDFIISRIINWSDAGSGNRYAVDFSVSYDTDINKVPELISAAVSTHPGVLQEPEPPDVELAGFGDSGVDFSVEFWVEGVDDGKNKYSSEVRFLIWNALKDAGIEIPFPQREIRYREGHGPA